MSAIDCPSSRLGFAGVTPPAASAAFTVTTLTAESALAAGRPDDASVTTMQKSELAPGAYAENVALPEVKVARAWTVLVSSSQDEDDPENSVAVKSGVPPGQVDVNATVCPPSIVGFAGEIEGTPRAGFTVTRSHADAAVTDELSVTV